MSEATEEKQDVSRESKVEQSVTEPSPELVHKRYSDFRAAVEGTQRVRYRVKPDYKTQYVSLMLFMLIIVLSGGIILNVSKSNVGDILVGSIMLLVVAIAIGVMISYAVRSRRVYYCYYVKHETGIFCMSVIGNTATVFTNGVAYRVDGDKFFTLDAEGYALWLDGEGPGLFALLLSSESDFEVIDDSVCYVHNRYGSGHEVHMSDGRITSIISDQPFASDVVDQKTGEAHVKLHAFEKCEPTDSFTLELPDFVKTALSGMGVSVELPDVSPAEQTDAPAEPRD